jgi:hypothetical protein
MIVKHMEQQEELITLHMFRAAFVFLFLQWYNSGDWSFGIGRGGGGRFSEISFHQNALHIQEYRNSTVQ